MSRVKSLPCDCVNTSEGLLYFHLPDLTIYLEGLHAKHSNIIEQPAPT